MKRIKWIILVLILLGGIIFLINVSGFRFNLNQFSVEKLANSEITVNDETLKNIKLDVRTAKVTFKQGNKAEIRFLNVSNKQFRITQKNGLSIIQNKSSQHQIEFGKTAEIEIITPKNISKLEIHQLNGTLNLKNIVVDKVLINHVNGTTFASNLTIVKSGTIDKKNGSTTLNKIEVPGLKVKVKTGSFKLDGVTKANSSETYDDGKPNQLQINSNTGQVKVTKM